jgi:hypothetical protein
MAGEIGASVVVVREIEVPGGWAEVGEKRGRGCGGVSEGESTTTEDDEEDEGTPSPFNLDASPGLFPMDPDVDAPSLTLTSSPTAHEEYTIDLEISSVYKPRPTRLSSSPSVSSTSPSPSNSPSQASTAKPKWYPKKKIYSQDDHTQGNGQGHRQTKQQAKALHRRLARDRRREEKKRALALASNSNSNSPPSPDTDQQQQTIQNTITDQTPASLVQGLESLHVSVDSTTIHVPLPSSPVLSRSGSSSPTVPIIDITSPTSPAFPNASPSSTGTALPHTLGVGVNGNSIKNDQKEGEGDVRLIVEALVVRKLSLEEAFLDFGGFSLI